MGKRLFKVSVNSFVLVCSRPFSSVLVRSRPFSSRFPPHRLPPSRGYVNITRNHMNT